MSLAIAVLASAPSRMTIGVGIVLGALGALVLLRATDTRLKLEYLVTGLALEAVLGAFLIVEGAVGQVVVGGETATVLGLAALGLPLIAQAFAQWVLKK